jgi:ferrous iron transport protein A
MADTQVQCALDSIPARTGGYIVTLSGGRSLVGRLAALGFVPGAPITMVQNYGRGPLIVALRQTRIALGRSEAGRVVVRVAVPVAVPKAGTQMKDSA